MTNIKSYSEMIKLTSYEERLKYLMLRGIVAGETFGDDRYLNQMLYKSNRWRRARQRIILRDEGYDLGIEDYPIVGDIYIHHINPISLEDIVYQRSCIFDDENLISTSFDTHNAIHYGNETILPSVTIERRINDTCPWKR